MGYTTIHLISPYLAYTRQDRRTIHHASFTLQVLVGILAGFGIASLTTVDIHSQAIHALAPFPVYELDPSDRYIAYIQSRHTIDPSTRCVVAPDAWARDRASIYSTKLSLPCIVCHKTRNEDGKISSLTRDDDRDIACKSLLIVDDMIDTGWTLASLITQLHTQWARHIYCLATHGIFSGSAYQILDTLHQDGILETIYISDSHPQKYVKSYIEVIGL
jgi:ribose-phosphate pyrophosphokinase